MILLSDLVRYAIKALTEKRFRAVLTIIGVAIGPLALVMMTSVVTGYTDFVEKQITGLGQNLIVVFPGETYELSENDINYFKSIEGVVDAKPFYSTQGVIKTPAGEKSVFIYAVDMNILFKALSSLKVKEGEIPSPYEVSEAVIGYWIAYDVTSGQKLFDVGDAISINIAEVLGAGRVRIKRVFVRVKGILEEYGGAPFLSPDHTIFLPLEAGRRLLGLKEWSGILILAEGPGYVDRITREIRNAYHETVSVVSFLEIARVVESITGAMEFITFATSLSAFAVAAAGIAATMMTSVIERTREIGVLKALGFTDGQVMSMILSEGIVISLIGASIGMGLGVIGAHILATRGFTIRGGVTLHIQAAPLITPELILRTLAITLLIGIVGSIFPAYRAAKIPPAVALRYE
ncbi:MAG: ABC transporter permease [Thermoprotei archaeon]|nr:MAG: ABC transporter permease [Thermoprotei archaeon]